MWRTTPDYMSVALTEVISIHVPRVEDDLNQPFFGGKNYISIHVPRVEDDMENTDIRGRHDISIHVPRVEDDRTRTLICTRRE